MSALPRVVHKFPIADTTLTLDLPASAEVALFGIQRGTFCVWIDRPVDDSGPSVRHEFEILGTGQSTTGPGWSRAASVHSPDGNFVFHLYERAIA